MKLSPLVVIASIIAAQADAAGLAITSDPQIICHAGYSATVRPPYEVARQIKRQMVGPFADMRLYVLDHIIPLSLGGHPSDRRNLQIQSKAEAEQKDRLEWLLLGMACYHHQITVAQAQAVLADWKTAFPVYCSTEGACPPHGEPE